MFVRLCSRRFSHSAVISLAVFALLAVSAGMAQDAGDSRGESVALPVRTVAETLAEAVYIDEFLRDPEQAAVGFEQVRADAQASVRQRQQATWRLARCMRRTSRAPAARVLLNNLLLDPSLPEAIRRVVARELTLIPRAEPARLMPADAVIYGEVPQPGVFLGRLFDLSRRAALDEAAIVARFVPYYRTDLPGLGNIWGDPVRPDLGELDALGVAWRDLRIDRGSGEADIDSEMLLMLHAGANIATQAVYDGVFTGYLDLEVQLAGVRFFAPATLYSDLYFTVSDGMFVMCTNPMDGADGVRRRRGEIVGKTLATEPRFRRRPAEWPANDAAFLYVDWQSLAEMTIKSYPAEERPYWIRGADLMSVRETGPVFASVALRDDELALELVTDLPARPGTMYELVQTPPVDPDMRRWLPETASFGLVTGVTPGDRRWKNFENFLQQCFDTLGMRAGFLPADDPAAARSRTPPLERLRRLENASELRVADDLCRDVRSLAVVGLPAPDPDTHLPLRWVVVLDVERPERWLRRIRLGLAGMLVGASADQPLLASQVDTPHGKVDLMALPGTGMGPAWQVRDSCIVGAWGVESLVEYLDMLDQHPPDRTPAAADRGMSKYIMVRLDHVLRVLYGYGEPPEPGPVLPPLIARTYETPEHLRIAIEQRQIADVLHAVLEVLAPELLNPPGPAWETRRPFAESDDGRPANPHGA